MSDDVKAALDRWTRNRAIQAGEDVPHPYEGTSWQVLEDLELLADAYAAEHAADDGQPYTDEWLRNLGYFDADTQTLRIKFGDQCELCAGNGNWSIGQNVGGRIYYVSIGDYYSRGSVRRLMRALGIEVKG